MSISIAHTYTEELEGVAQKDVSEVKIKDAAYGGSWKKRGGIGAYMMMCRKWDRLEKAVEQEYGFDIFAAIEKDPRDESVLDDIRDLRRYLLLIESEIQSRRTIAKRARAVDNFQKPIDLESPPEDPNSGSPPPEDPNPWVPNPWIPNPLTNPLTPIKYVSQPGTSPVITFIQPETVSRTETIAPLPNRTVVRSDGWVGDCPCGDSTRPGHPSTWCEQESKRDA